MTMSKTSKTAKHRKRRNAERGMTTAGILAPYLVFGAILGTTWLVLWQVDKRIVSKKVSSSTPLRANLRVRRRRRN